MGEAGGRDGRHQAAVAFCSALWCFPDGSPRDDLDGLCATIFVTGDGGNRCEWLPLSAPQKIIARIVELDAKPGTSANIYVGATATGPRESLPRENGRLRDRPHAVDARAMVGVWADIDIASLGGHGEKAYPPDEAAARALLDRLPLRPSLILHSGHGLQVWWLLTEPWRFGEIVDQDADRDVAADLSRDWCHTVAAHAEDAGGWAIDPTFDLARLMRPAGTTNRKPNLPQAPVRVVLADGPTYDLDDLYAGLADQAILKRYRMPTVGPEALGGIDLFRVWARVSSMASRERGYTPPWIATMIENMGDVGALADTWDGGHAGPDGNGDPSTVDARITRLLFDAGCTTEQVCEAIMALHLRTGHKVDKVDPSKRTDYLVRTVGRFRETSRQAAENRAERGATKSRADGAVAHAASLHRTTEHAEPAVAPTPPESAAEPVPEPDVVEPAAAASPGGDVVPSNDTDETVTAPQRDDHTPTTRAPAGADDSIDDDIDDGGVEATTSPNEPDPGADALAEHVIDAVRHPVDEHHGEHVAPDSPVATPAPDGAPSTADPWGKRDEHEGGLLDEITALALHHSYVVEGVKVWRVEYRNHGAKQEGRLILYLPRSFTWPGGDRPALYHPGRPLATAWLPRAEFNTHKGFHTALAHDAKMVPRELAPKGQQPQPHQADAGTWRALITAMIPYWRRDSSGTDLATAVHEWLRQLLTERPAVRDGDDAAANGRPWLVDHGAFRADPPPRIYVARSVLLDFIAAQPGAPAPGPGSASVLELLRLTPRRVRGLGAVGRRMRWLEIDAEQFDAEDWAGIVEDTAEAMLTRERNAERRRGMRLVADGETRRSATEEMQARLVGDDASSEATLLASGQHDGGAPASGQGGRGGQRPDYEGEEI